jgi:hypothetical protein
VLLVELWLIDMVVTVTFVKKHGTVVLSVESQEQLNSFHQTFCISKTFRGELKYIDTLALASPCCGLCFEADNTAVKLRPHANDAKGVFFVLQCFEEFLQN